VESNLKRELHLILKRPTMTTSANTVPQLHDLVRARYSPRAFADRSIEAAELDLLFEAARWAPSCFNEQPWRFIVATREDADAHAKMCEGLLESNRLWAAKAPVLLLCATVTTFSRNDTPNALAQHDLGLAMGSLTTQATALGLSVHMMAGINRDLLRESYAIPANVALVCAAAIGYAGPAELLPEALAERERAPRVRKPRSELVFAGRFGAPRSDGV